MVSRLRSVPTQRAHGAAGPSPRHKPVRRKDGAPFQEPHEESALALGLPFPNSVNGNARRVKGARELDVISRARGIDSSLRPAPCNGVGSTLREGNQAQPGPKSDKLLHLLLRERNLEGPRPLSTH